MVVAGFRYLEDVETRYSVAELEAMEDKYGIEQYHQHLSGLPNFEVITDHRPLKKF